MSKYNVGDKFIVEIDSEVYEGDMANLSPKYYTLKGLSGLAIIEKGIDKLQKCETELSWDEAYIKGLNEAWKCARKIFTTDCATLQKVLGSSDEGTIIMLNEPQAILAKLEAYENEIKVGDVVESTTTGKEFLIITEENDDSDYEFGVIDLERMIIDRICNDTRYFKKTGKHIDIQSVLEQIKE